MSSTVDLIAQSLSSTSGTVDEKLRQYYIDNSTGDNTLSLPELENLFLREQLSVTSGATPDLWKAFLESKEYSGSISQMLNSFWAEGGVLAPDPSVITALNPLNFLYVHPDYCYSSRTESTFAGGNVSVDERVGTLEDLSSNNNHYSILTSDGNRPFLRQDENDNYYLEMDGANTSGFVAGSSVSFGTESGIYVSMAKDTASDDIVRLIGATATILSWRYNNTLFDCSFNNFTTNSGRIQKTAGANTNPRVMTWDRGDGRTGQYAELFIDGSTLGTADHDQTTGSHTPVIGGSGTTGNSNKGTFKFYGMVILDNISNRSTVETWLADTSGVTLS